ncbi:hypothetical protein KK062_10955 [Fulvivirgaceae bacterium PWU5]|uniref:Uncharacterized protein n=1 Tax=Dawidia cretensis TaxID=2782350 RepID=A0AAP2GVB6_9BACT|nr:hypothetical protein [Dawidia cretensis]MBT1708747.1 hypothetical protein [Dawidia cretensis]
MQSVDDTAFKSLRPMLRNLVQKVHGHAGTYDPSEKEIADAIGPLLYKHAVNVPREQFDLEADMQRLVLHVSLQTLGRFLRIARNLGIITCHSGKDLCQRIATNVRTIGSSRPSPKGLLKAFGEPNSNNFHEYAAAQQRVRDICSRIIEYIDEQKSNRQKE